MSTCKPFATESVQRPYSSDFYTNQVLCFNQDMEIDLSQLSEKDTYGLLTQTIIPRPIAWVLTQNHAAAEEEWNLAPFSFFNGAASSPAMVMFSIGSWDVSGRVKDTLINLRSNKYATIGISSVSSIYNVQSSATELEYGRSELNAYNIESLDWEWPTPKIKECKINFACSLFKEVHIEDSSQVIVFCKVDKIDLHDATVTVDEHGRITVLPELIDPLLRLGSGKYGSMGRVIPKPAAG